MALLEKALAERVRLEKEPGRIGKGMEQEGYRLELDSLGL